MDSGTLLAFARAESGLNPYAIYDNTLRSSFFPPSVAGAATLANALLNQGHSLDLGIMQVNSANLARTGLTVATAFDPGQSMRAGAMILVAAYQQCRRGGQVEPQQALRCAASVYNTGREQAGILNGYQARVWQVAAQIVPAIQTAGIEAGAQPQGAIENDDLRARAVPRRCGGCSRRGPIRSGRARPAVSSSPSGSRRHRRAH